MGEKKVDDKNFYVTFLLCIILVTAIVSIIAFYSSIIKYKDNTINSLNSKIADKDEQISSLVSEKDNLQSQIDSLNSEKDSLQSQLDNLTEIVELDKSEVWINEYFMNVKAGTFINLNRTIDYAGYIKFEQIGGMTTTETGEIYVQVIWTRRDLVFYNEKMVVGEDTFFRFPVLPTSNLQVRLGYDDPSNGTANIRATIFYVY